MKALFLCNNVSDQCVESQKGWMESGLTWEWCSDNTVSSYKTVYRPLCWLADGGGLSCSRSFLFSETVTPHKSLLTTAWFVVVEAKYSMHRVSVMKWAEIHKANEDVYKNNLFLLYWYCNTLHTIWKTQSFKEILYIFWKISVYAESHRQRCLVSWGHMLVWAF